MEWVLLTEGEGLGNRVDCFGDSCLLELFGVEWVKCARADWSGGEMCW